VRPLSLLIGWATPEAAICYEYALLRPADKQRAQCARGIKAELDWRVSRALIASLPTEHRVLSLSHSRGHALCVSADREIVLGVDIEHMASRDVLRLGRWICSDDEFRALEGLAAVPDRQAEYFYLLWTVKEAFIKALDLDFPAGMHLAGFAGAPDKGLRLRHPKGSWWACAWKLLPDKMAAIVWQGAAHEKHDLVWHVGPGANLPPRSCMGVWHSATA